MFRNTLWLGNGQAFPISSRWIRNQPLAAAELAHAAEETHWACESEASVGCGSHNNLGKLALATRWCPQVLSVDSRPLKVPLYAYMERSQAPRGLQSKYMQFTRTRSAGPTTQRVRLPRGHRLQRRTFASG